MIRHRSPFMAVCLLSAVLALPDLARAKQPKCFPREGHCVAVTVNSQPAVPLTKATKKALKSLEEISHYVDDTRYEVAEPIRGELDVSASLAQGAESQLGEGGQVDVQIVLLSEVEIETREQLVAEPSVRIGGQAAVGVGHFLEDNRLPPGQYLLRVKLRGPDNWDRQTIYFTVEE